MKTTRQLINEIIAAQQTRANMMSAQGNYLHNPTKEYTLLGEALARLMELDHAVGCTQRNDPSWSAILTAANEGRLKSRTKMETVYEVVSEPAGSTAPAAPYSYEAALQEHAKQNKGLDGGRDRD